MKIFNYLAIFLIRVYQLTLSRWLHLRGLRCRHHPNCSQYALIAFLKYDFFKAVRLSTDRYRACRPNSSRPFVDFP
jgi:putative component of membrane protein insertase Oxa1/YidC/SpoIIIJ protein YidD